MKVRLCGGAAVMKMVWRCGGDEDGVAVWTAAGKKKMVLRFRLFSVCFQSFLIVCVLWPCNKAP
jgi:hypothetical protein